jgi:hypothetical protein
LTGLAAVATTAAGFFGLPTFFFGAGAGPKTIIGSRE